MANAKKSEINQTPWFIKTASAAVFVSVLTMFVWLIQSTVKNNTHREAVVQQIQNLVGSEREHTQSMILEERFYFYGVLQEFQKDSQRRLEAIQKTVTENGRAIARNGG